MSGTCDGCEYALWRRTDAGRLHPSKQGRCDYLRQYPLILQVPSAFYWLRQTAPTPYGGVIERGYQMEKPCTFKKPASVSSRVPSTDQQEP